MEVTVMKRFILTVSSLLSVMFSFGNTVISPLNPSKTVFCWDIHDTLVARDRGKFNKMVMSLTWRTFMGCWEVADIVRNAKNYPSNEYTEALLLKRAEEYEQKAHSALLQGKKRDAKKHQITAKKIRKIAAIFHNFELTYKPKKGMVELLRALKNHGFTAHRVASNIGSNNYQELKPMHPELFNDDMVRDGLTVNAWEEPVLKKPDYMFFKKLQQMFNPEGDKTMIFIDDLDKNVEAARACGFTAIKIKNAEQLVNDLNKIGFNLKYTRSKHKQYVNGKMKHVVTIA